jgi:hypothetical protein
MLHVCGVCGSEFQTVTQAGTKAVVCSVECADEADEVQRDALRAEALVVEARAAREHLLDLAQRFEDVARGEFGDADVVLVVSRIDTALEQFRGRFA